MALAFSTLMAMTAAASPAQPGGFAVIELFTSEGCSSCPPADEAVGRLTARARAEGLPVYALEWHVDYWDYLGWKDPFAFHLATERQYAYARALPSDVYTPQAVLNGTLVPSWAGDEAEIERDARALAKSPASASLHVQLRPQGTASSLRVAAQASGGAPGSRLLVVLLEDGLGARPTAGENAGRALLHSSVVRSMAVLPAAGGEADLAVPPGVDMSHASIVGVLQEPSMRIVAADRAGMPGAGRISGRLLDSRGRPEAGMTVQACSGTVCVPAVTGPDGSFAFASLWPGSWSLVAGRGVKPVDVSLAAGQAIEVPLTAP